MIGLLGWLWWLVVPIRRRLAVANYRWAFPDRDAGELRRSVGEVVWGYLQLAIGVQARLEGLDQVRPGTICLAGHGASWDLALVSAAQHLPISIFVKTPSNPLAAWVIERLRRRGDLELLPPSNSMPSAYAALSRGRLVVFVLDQRHNQGIDVPFFGRPARTSPAFAAMLHRTHAPVVGAWPRRDERGRHVVRFEPLPVDVPTDREEAVRTITAASQRWYEDRIRERPLSWWWLHDRWKVPG